MFKNSFVKLACINPVVEVGLPLENAKEIVNALKKSRASINLFPELATTGYSCGDLFHHEGLMKENYEAIDYIEKNGNDFLERLGYRAENGVYRILNNNEEKVALFTKHMN